MCTVDLIAREGLDLTGQEFLDRASGSRPTGAPVTGSTEILAAT